MAPKPIPFTPTASKDSSFFTTISDMCTRLLAIRLFPITAKAPMTRVFVGFTQHPAVQKEFGIVMPRNGVILSRFVVIFFEVLSTLIRTSEMPVIRYKSPPAILGVIPYFSFIRGPYTTVEPIDLWGSVGVSES